VRGLVECESDFFILRRPITGRIRHEFHIGTRAPGKGDLVRLSYPAVSTDTRQARLTMRDSESDTRTELSAASWEFTDAQSIRLLPPGSLFAPFKIYELWYEATGSEGARHRLCRSA
jgi:hypothetical protein